MDVRKIFDYIDTNSAGYVSLWRDVCNIESKSGDKAALDRVSDTVEKFASSLGFGVTRKPFEKTGDFLMIDLNSAAPDAYAFLAHMDTVHDKGKFGYPPVKINDNIMTGPGVIDCKGGIAVALLAMKALAENGYNRHLRLILTSDEEVSNTLGGKEGIDFIMNGVRGFRGAFNCEVGVDGEALVARKGILRVRLDITGKAAHSGIAYFDGRSAVREAAYKIIRLESASTDGGTTYNCAIIHGGDTANIVPAHCSVVVDIRVRTSEGMERASEFVNAVAAENNVADTQTSVYVISRRPPMVRTAENEALFEKLENVSEAYGLGVLKAAESGGGSDSAYTQLAGVPTVCGLGTTGDYCHTPNEYARISSLADRAKLLAATCALN